MRKTQKLKMMNRNSSILPSINEDEGNDRVIMNCAKCQTKVHMTLEACIFLHEIEQEALCLRCTEDKNRFFG